jgi:hypothetical protein
MASFHLSVKTVGRAAGRSSTAAAAYRAGKKIVDERTGEIHDYRRRGGVESAELILPTDSPDWASDRGKLWNAAEVSETRKNSTVAREFEIALPAELSLEQRQELARDFAREIVVRHGCAADVAIHAPGGKGDNRNHHAHILCTTRRLTPDGFGEKCRELDDKKTGEVDRWRERFAELQNQHLERAGVVERVDHRSHKARGIEKPPEIHLGPAATAIERRGEESEKTQHHQERQQEAAGKVAALVAIAEAQSKAATEIKEKENDRIRAEAFERIGKNVGDASRASAATHRAGAFALADHGGIAENLRAASGDLERAVKGAQRRVSERHYGRVVEAVRGQFERVGGVVQQVADRVGSVVRTVAVAAHQVAQKVRLELERKRAEKPMGIAPSSRYHPDDIAKRAKEAAPVKPAPMTTQELFHQRQAEQLATMRRGVEIERERKPEPPKVNQEEVDALLLQAASAKKVQWDAALVAERALYLAELTAQAHAQCVRHVAQHQAHIDAKPMLFGKDAWEAQRRGFENRDHSNKGAWQDLKEGRYPFIAKDKEAVQEAVERRVSDKKPELTLSMPGVYAALQAGRERAAVVEAQARAEKAKYREVDAALAAFEAIAHKREMKTASYGDYRDTGQRWNAISQGMREAIDGYNVLPKEARPVVLARMKANIGHAPTEVQKWQKQLGGPEAAQEIYRGR